MAHFKFSDISKIWHSKPKHAGRKATHLKSATQNQSNDNWGMSPEDALRVTYSGNK